MFTTWTTKIAYVHFSSWSYLKILFAHLIFRPETDWNIRVRQKF